MQQPAEIKISKRKLTALFRDNAKCAEAINLVYVSDKQPGIARVKKNDDFIYVLNQKPVHDEKIISRIKSLVLPPAWQHVWICTDENGHLQATGIDAKNRKQYKYHPLWNSVRNQTKFHHLLEFGKVLPAIRQQLEKDLAKKGLPLEKVLAAVVSVMQCTCIRIGNSAYEQLYGSFGISTMKDKHVTFKGETVKFAFRGKKGIQHNISLKSKKLANIVKQCRDIPGKELFQYYDSEGHRHPIDSGMVNDYIRSISGGYFTAKDFRTWAGTLRAIEAFQQMGMAQTITETKKNIVSALDTVAGHLGNTRTVCKKYYVHPVIIDLYSSGSLHQHLEKSKTIKCDPKASLSPQEHVLMNILHSSIPALRVA